MKYINLLILLALSIFNILKFERIELFLTNVGLSWTLSKLIPYLTLILLGFLLARWFKRRIIFKLPYVRKIVFITALFLPFIAGFIINPIYSGDFSQNGTEIADPVKMSDFRNADLAVIAIPGCPHCFGSIAKLKRIKDRNPKIRIKFIVCTKSNADLKEYQTEGGTAITVVKANNPETLGELAEGRFPTFALVLSSKAVYKWSNDQFGVRAIDKLEDDLKPKK